MQEAQLAGLRALVNILHEKSNKETRQIYERARKRLDTAIDQWNQSVASGNPDFSYVTKKENTFRGDELDNIWKTTTSYGNTENKRVMSERYGSVGPMNRFLNTFGGILRNLTLFLLPLEQPTNIGKQKSRIIWGYQSEEVGDVPVAHGADLAELDLADMIRSHGRELARKSFISSVDFKEFSRYAYLLVRRLLPFIEYLYTDGMYGRKTFHRPKNKYQGQTADGPCADDILKELVHEIESLFGSKRGRLSRLSKMIPKRPSTLVKNFFEDQINELLSNPEAIPSAEIKQRVAWAKDLRELTEGKKPRLRLQDAVDIKEQAATVARWEGTRCHSILTYGFLQPFNLPDLLGSKIPTQKLDSKFSVATEVPIPTVRGAGKADIVLLQSPSEAPESSLLKPVAVFEIKSRTGMNWNLVAKNVKTTLKDKDTGKPLKKVIGKAFLRKRWLNEREWEQEIGCIPTSADGSQLRLYERGLLGAYQRSSGDDSVKRLLKGVFLVDSQKDIAQTKQELYSFFTSLDLEKLTELSQGRPDRILVRNKDDSMSHIALMLDAPKSEEITSILDEVQHSTGDRYDPFKHVLERKNDFILYLALPSASRSGTTAAWIAMYWHCIQFMNELAKKKHLKQVRWIDLSGEFAYRPLAEIRLRIHDQSYDIRQFFSHIDFIDISPEIEAFLFKGQKPPSIPLSESSLVVVSGWEFIVRSCPSRLRSSLKELERILVESLADSDSHILWFGHAPTYEATSSLYHKRSHLPFHESSYLSRHVTRIVWNLPVKPYALIHSTPLLDDVRVIIDQQQQSYTTTLVNIPILKDWSPRFWSQRSKKTSRKASSSKKGRQPLTADEAITSEVLSEELKEDALDLIPWIKETSKDTIPIDLRPIDLQYIPLYGRPSPLKGVLSRLTFRRRSKGAKGRKSFAQQQVPLHTLITHPRKYCKRILKEKPIRESHRSPMEELLVLNAFNSDYANKTEIRRLRRILKLFEELDDDCFKHHHWRSLISKLKDLVDKDRSEPARKLVREIRKLIEQSEVSKDIWDEFMWIRENALGQGLTLKESENLNSITVHQPQITSYYGNYLFIFLIAMRLLFPSLTITHLEYLWDAVKSWVLVQIGYEEKQHEAIYGRPKFHARAIWHNLMKRARTLTELFLPPQERIRFGKLVTTGDVDEPYTGLFIEDEFDRSRYVYGFWNTLTPLRADSRFSWTLSNHREIVDAAESLMDKESSLDLLFASLDGDDYLWEKYDDEWIPVGKVSIVYRKRDAIARIRGIRIEPMQGVLDISPPEYIKFPSMIGKDIEQALLNLTQRARNTYSVHCVLGVKDDRYVIDLFVDDEIVDTRHISETAELIALLRTPLTEGVPLRSSQDSSVGMTWDPYRDVIYNELQLLRPYIERRTPYVNVEVPLPSNCHVLLARPKETLEVVVSHDEAHCPIAEGVANDHGLCWKVTFDTEQNHEDLERFESALLSDHDISSMMLGNELFFEHGRYELDIRFEHSVTTLQGRVFRESKRIARLLGERSIPPGSFQFIDTEQLVYELTKARGGIHILVRSSVTGHSVQRGTLIIPEQRWTVEGLLEEFKEETEIFVFSYFGMDVIPEKRVSEYQGMLDTMKQFLKDLRKKP